MFHKFQTIVVLLTISKQQFLPCHSRYICFDHCIEQKYEQQSCQFAINVIHTWRSWVVPVGIHLHFRAKYTTKLRRP